MDENPTRILSMEVRDIRRIRLADVRFDEDQRVVVVSGRNGAGKSSLLDSFLYALVGPDRKDTPHPVRDGAEEGSVFLDLGSITVARRIGVDGKTLSLDVRDKATGAQLRSPQRTLNALLGEFNAFDPIEFMALPAKAQVTTLLGIVDLPFDPERLDTERQLFYDRRREINRDVTRLQHVLDEMEAPRLDLPSEPISTAAIVGEVREAEQELAMHRSLRSQADRAANAVIQHTATVERLAAELASTKELLAAAMQERDDLESEISGLVEPDIEVLQKRMADAEKINDLVRAEQNRQALMAEVAEVRAQSDEFTRKIDEIDRTKAEALARADMPVAGLSFDADGLTLDVDGTTVPLRQCSSAEQLRVSMAMAMRANPSLRVVRIADGSLLDTESMRLVGELAEANDFWVFVERVSDEVDAGVIEITADGQVHT